MLDLKTVAETLCKGKEGTNCELFVRVKNQMSSDQDVTITLMLKESVIELKDGIWNYFKINEVAENTHFYFFPKHKNKSVTLTYHSDMVDLKIAYALWKFDYSAITPADWPFPEKISEHKALGFSPTQFVHVSEDYLKKCWPNCVLLVTTFKDDSGLKGKFNSYLEESKFKIMVSNNYMELPQKMKVDVVMQKEEQKHLLVDLKHVMDNEAVTFFTYFSVGSVKLTANVYDESNPRCPTADEGADFSFGNLETEIELKSIKDRISENQMNEDKNPYLCILAQSYMDSKFSIEYSTEKGLIKQLNLDSFYTEKVGKEDRLLQVDATQEFSLKITRTNGFPYFAYQTCKSTEDFEDCLEKFQSEAKETQLADKMTSLSPKPCEKCILFLKFRSDDPAELNIHVQSKYSETELQA